MIATRSEHKLRELPRAAPARTRRAGVARRPRCPWRPGRGPARPSRPTPRSRPARPSRPRGLPSLADDSGLEVDALDGGPGVRTRRYAGEHATDADNNAKLLAALDGLPADRRGARYVCVLALALPGDTGPRGGQRVTFARGTCRGRIAPAPRGTGGFGYDPIFEPASEAPGGRTLGLWTPAEKHAISHRARAARRMSPRLAALGF